MMKAKVGDLIVMCDESSIHGMMGVVIAEETNHSYGQVWVNGKARMFGGNDVDVVVAISSKISEPRDEKSSSGGDQ